MDQGWIKDGSMMDQGYIKDGSRRDQEWLQNICVDQGKFFKVEWISDG